jgi:hypothetical protein
MHASARPWSRVWQCADRHPPPSERKRRATIHRAKTVNPYPLPRGHQTQLPPASFSPSPRPRSPVSLSTHTSVSLCYCYLTSRTSHHACLFPLLTSPAPAPFLFTSPVSLLPRPACACLFGCLSWPSSSRFSPGKSRAHATTTCSRAGHRLLTHPQPSIVLRVLFV